MQFKWEYIHSCRKGQFNNLLTIWLLTISEPVDSSVSVEVSDVVQLTWEDHFCCFFERNLLLCSVSVLELKMSHLYPFRIIHAVSNVNSLPELVLLAEEKYMSCRDFCSLLSKILNIWSIMQNLFVFVCWLLFFVGILWHTCITMCWRLFIDETRTKILLLLVFKDKYIYEEIVITVKCWRNRHKYLKII